MNLREEKGKIVFLDKKIKRITIKVIRNNNRQLKRMYLNVLAIDSAISNQLNPKQINWHIMNKLVLGAMTLVDF